MHREERFAVSMSHSIIMKGNGSIYSNVGCIWWYCNYHRVMWYTYHMAIAVKAKICTQSVITLYKSIHAKATLKSSPLQRMKYTIICVIILEWPSLYTVWFIHYQSNQVVLILCCKQQRWPEFCIIQHIPWTNVYSMRTRVKCNLRWTDSLLFVAKPYPKMA